MVSQDLLHRAGQGVVVGDGGVTDGGGRRTGTLRTVDFYHPEGEV